MKKIVALSLILLLVISCIGCSKEAPDYQRPLNCYYLSKTIQYNTSNAVIGCEQVEGALLVNESLGQFLRQYLKGPDSKDLVSPFPAGTFLVHLAIDNDTVKVRLSNEFSILTGHDLTLACACITLTILDYTGLSYVSISVEGASLNDKMTLTLSRDDLIFLDPAANY